VAETAELSAERRADASDAQPLYAHLVGRHYASVYNYLRWLARDEVLAADLTDEAFVQLWRYLPRPRRGGSLRAFVFKIALNLYRRHLRHDGVELLPLEEAERAPADAWHEPPLVLERDELRRHVRLAVERLPDTCRAVIPLHNLEGFTLREVAEILEVPVGTAKSRLAAGFPTLRRLPRWTAPEGRAERLVRMVRANGGAVGVVEAPMAERPVSVRRQGARARLTLKETLLAAGVLAILCAILLPVAGVLRAKLAAPNAPPLGSRRWHYDELSHCVLHLQNVAPAMLEYARDHGGRLPDAANWQTAVLPYLAEAAAELNEPAEELVRCPAWRADAYLQGVPVGNGGYSYRMAPELSGRLVQTIPDPARQPMLYDASADGTFTARHLLQTEVRLGDAMGLHRQIWEEPMAVIAYLHGRLDMLSAGEHRVVKELPWEEPAPKRQVPPEASGGHQMVGAGPQEFAWKPRPTPPPGWRKEGPAAGAR